LGIEQTIIDRLIENASQDSGWRSLATPDAAACMVDAPCAPVIDSVRMLVRYSSDTIQ
jgi:hypothetical protein